MFSSHRQHLNVAWLDLQHQRSYHSINMLILKPMSISLSPPSPPLLTRVCDIEQGRDWWPFTPPKEILCPKKYRGHTTREAIFHQYPSFWRCILKIYFEGLLKKCVNVNLWLRRRKKWKKYPDIKYEFPSPICHSPVWQAHFYQSSQVVCISRGDPLKHTQLLLSSTLKSWMYAKKAKWEWDDKARDGTCLKIHMSSEFNWKYFSPTSLLLQKFWPKFLSLFSDNFPAEKSTPFLLFVKESVNNHSFPVQLGV